MNSSSRSDDQNVELKEENTNQSKDIGNNHSTDAVGGDGNGYYCVVNEEELEEKLFSHNYELNAENYEMFKAILDNFDPDDKLKDKMKEKLRISDFTYEFVERRFKKYHSEDQYATYRYRECLTNIGILLGMTLLIIGFLLLSALPIWAIEGANEYADRVRNNVSLYDANGTLTRLEKWSYGNSVYYCLVTFTTIGYGDMAASTPGGRVYIGFFGLIGIAIMGTLLVTVGKTTTGGVKNVLLLISMGCYKLVGLVRKTEGRMKKKDLVYRILFSSAIQLGYYTVFWLGYAFVCAAIMMALEGWSYNDSLWYVFVTLATIGYGDFYPKTQGGKVFFMFFSIIGLGFESIMIGLISELAIDGIKKIKKKMSVWRRKRKERN